jgi:hypothetical protein
MIVGNYLFKAQHQKWTFAGAFSIPMNLPPTST